MAMAARMSIQLKPPLTTSVQPLIRSHAITAGNGAVILEIVMTLKYRGVEYTKNTK